MKDLKHIKRFNESEENFNISDVRSSKKSTWDGIFERLAIKCNNFDEFGKNVKKLNRNTNNRVENQMLMVGQDNFFITYNGWVYM
jgi:predicted ATP-dependent Lon-type protease